MGESRVHKTLLNAKVNLLFYFLSLFFAFFSRKIFLDCLGANFIGLTGTLGSILGYLNLAELGIGSAVSFFLFKPLQQHNENSINEIISLFGYLYRKIGKIILMGGIIISTFFPLIFKNTEVQFGIIYFSFYSFLFSSLAGYFINYRQLLLNADQKNYIVSIYFQSAGIIKTILQIYLAYVYKNLYVWVLIEFVFSIIACIVLNRKINKEYPWLKTDIKSGKSLLKKYPEVISSTKNVFIHKIKDFLLNKSDELFIFIFVSLKMVAYYGNYVMIINKLSLLFMSLFDGTLSGVGNLVAEGDKKKIISVFWELMAIRHFIAGFMCFTIYYLINPFINLWLGEQYILSNAILVLLIINLYIVQSRSAVDMFNHAYGLYADTWSAWAELFINVSITIVGGYLWGIIGILLGKIISTFVIILFWKPYYLFKCGFHISIYHYFKKAYLYYLINISTFILGYCVIEFIDMDIDKYFVWILYSLFVIGLYLLIAIPLLYKFCPGTNSLYIRIKNSSFTKNIFSYKHKFNKL